MDKIKLGLPKGSLESATFELFNKAGFRIYSRERSYTPVCDDSEMLIRLVRAQEMARYVSEGIFDCGITGYDWICESNVEVINIGELIYAKSGFQPVRWVLAVPENSPIERVEDLQDKRIATELVNVVTKYFRARNIDVKVEFSWGATEIKAPEFVDAIVELTETGSSLRANKLRVIEEILKSTTRFIANPRAWQNKKKREKMENIFMLLQGALNAANLVGMKMNLKRSSIAKITKLIPGLKKPTISALTIPGWVAMEVVLEESIVRTIIPRLKRAGAQGIIEYPLNKVIY